MRFNIYYVVKYRYIVERFSIGFWSSLKKNMSSSSPISSYVQSMIENDASNNISEEEVFEITTKATSSSNVYSGFAELANALERLR